MREAILHLDDRQLERIGLADLVTATREAGLRDLTELVCHGSGGVMLVQLDERLPEDELDEYESVVWWERLAVDPSGTSYLCKIDAPELDEDFAMNNYGVAHEISGVHDDGFDLSVVGTQEEISQSVAAADEAGMNALLRRLSDYSGPSSVIDELTERQREVLETAHRMGYYDVPRQVAAEDVAEEVGLDQSTVAEHLQRAERNVLNHVLEGTGNGVGAAGD